MVAESRFAEVSDKYLSSLLHKSIPKSTKKSTKYGMKIFKVAQNSFQHLYLEGSLQPLYHLMLQSWYQKTAQSLVNTSSFS